ncbi:60S ribosomal protein L28 [Friedmanniomyces endolithicus]|nr:60S ribosomal protein L28 [Friedmanniomyces endolithicus]
MDKYHPGYFGKVGMRYFHKMQNGFWKPVINLDKVSTRHMKERRLGEERDVDNLPKQLWSLVPLEQREKYLANKGSSDTAPVLDLLPLGYSKVLGKGRIPRYRSSFAHVTSAKTPSARSRRRVVSCSSSHKLAVRFEYCTKRPENMVGTT